jgi:hypothetical protein
MLAFGAVYQSFRSNSYPLCPNQDRYKLVTEGVTVLRSKLSASFPVHLPSYILKLLSDAHD